MSKNSNEEQLNSRLSNVFSDVDKPIVFPGLKATSDLTGWIWEIDPRGSIIGCSPEIEIFTNIPAKELIGNQLSEFCDFSLETAGLPTNPHRAMLPTRLEIGFSNQDGSTTLTESFILAKVSDDGDILSWRGITSVIQQEPAEIPQADQPAEEPKDQFKALATLDITPEIPQPDLSLSDIWRESSKDTAPLSMEDVLAESEAFQSSLENTGTGELMTFQVNRVPEMEEVEDVEDLPEPSEVEEAVENLFSEPEFAAEKPPAETIQEIPADAHPETLSEETSEALFDMPEDEPEASITEVVEQPPAEPMPEVEPAESFEVEEVEEILPIMSFGGEPPADAALLLESVEEQETADDQPPPQDEIETIRYSSETFAAEIAQFERQPETEQAEFSPETEHAQEEIHPDWMVEMPKVSEVERQAFTDIETADLSGSPSEPVESFETADEQSWSEPAPQAHEDQQIAEHAQPLEEIDQAPETDWVPEFKAMPVTGSLQPPASMQLDEATTAGTPASTDVPTKPLSPEEILRKFDEPIEDKPEESSMFEQPAQVDFSGFEDVPPTEETGQAPDDFDVSDLDLIETEEALLINTKELQDPYLPQDVEITEDLSFVQDSFTTADAPPEHIQEEFIPEEEIPADTKELDVQAISPRDRWEPETAPLASEPEFESSALESLPDLDIDEGASPTASEVVPPQPPIQTGSKHPRRPIIDTGSLIPSLMRGQPSTQPQTDTLDFFQSFEEDTVKIKTKELETYTSSDGVELTISRGVQELLKIVDDNPHRVWKEDELRLVEQVHNQLELALENANLFQQTQLALAETDERARQLRLLNQLSEQINQTDDLTEIFNIVAEKARDIFSIDMASIAVISDDRKTLQVVAAAGENAEASVGTARVIENSNHQVVIRENRVFITPTSTDSGEFKSGMTGPITTSNIVIGTLNLTSKQPNLFNDRDANLLTQLLSITNASVENRRLFNQIESALATTEEQARRLAELNRLSEQFSSATSIDEVFNLIAINLSKIIPTDFWGYASLDDEDEIYQLRLSSRGLTASLSFEDHNLSRNQSLKDSIIGKSVREKRTITEFNCRDSQYNDVKQWSEHSGIRTAMATPIVAGENSIGAIVIGSKQLSAYTVQEENILLSIARLSGSTIDNRQLLTQIQKRSQQLETSAEVSRVASTILDPAELLPRVVELIKDGFNLYYAGIFLLDDSGEITGEPGKWAVLRAGSGEAGKQMVAAGHRLEIGGESMIGTAVSSSQARIALNVGQEASFFRNPYLPDTRSEMALPLSSRGQVLGALSIQSELEEAFSPEDITALQTLADQLANAIENARLFEQTEIRAEELTVLNEMARGFSQSMSINVLIENTYEFTGRLMDANNFYMVLFYPEEGFFEYRILVEAGEKVDPPMKRVKLGVGLTDWIIKNKLPVLIPGDVETYLQALGVEPRGRMPKSWLGVPMLLGNEVTGVIAVQSFVKENVYNNHALDLLIAVSSQAAVAIDNARRFQATQTVARHEEILRRVTTQVHSTSDPDVILRTAVREVSDALGKPAFVKLAPKDRSAKQDIPVTNPFEVTPPHAEFPPDDPFNLTEAEER